MGRLITLPRDMPEKKTPQVRFYSHACIAIEGERDTLLTDPWFFGDVFHNSWTLLAPPDIDTIDFNRVRTSGFHMPTPTTSIFLRCA